MRATPASVPAGGAARLDALVAGPDGVVGAPRTWTLLAGDGASIAIDGAGDAWLAVDPGAPPGVAELELTVAVAGAERDLTGVKQVAIGVDERANPEVAAVLADGAATAEDELAAPAGSVLALRAEVEPTEAEDQVSWFATVGEIELYRRNPTELVLP